MRTAGVILAITIALALQTTLTRYALTGATAIELALVAVVYVALTFGPVNGMLAGTFAGLVEDALLSGVIGIGGLAKTIVGFVAGLIGTQFIVTAMLPRFVVFFGATVVHEIVFRGLYVVLGLRDFGSPYAAVFGQALGNAIAGVVVFQVVELLPGAVSRRRMGKTAFRR